MSEYPEGYMTMSHGLDKYRSVPFTNSMQPTKTWLLQHIIRRGYHRVLDYGCGRGSLGFTGPYQVKGDHYLSVVGLDHFSPENPAAQLKSLEEAERDSWDCIVASHVLEHYKPAEVRQILHWMSQRLRPDGGLVIVLPNAGDNPFVYFQRDSTHVQPYNIPELFYWLEQAGFKIEKVVRSDFHNLRWYSKWTRLISGKLHCYSPFDDWVVLCHR